MESVRIFSERKSLQAWNKRLFEIGVLFVERGNFVAPRGQDNVVPPTCAQDKNVGAVREGKTKTKDEKEKGKAVGHGRAVGGKGGKRKRKK